MKTKLRENRASKGTIAKVERIIKDLRANPPGENLEGASGAKLFAQWKNLRGR